MIQTNSDYSSQANWLVESPRRQAWVACRSDSVTHWKPREKSKDKISTKQISCSNGDHNRSALISGESFFSHFWACNLCITWKASQTIIAHRPVYSKLDLVLEGIPNAYGPWLLKKGVEIDCSVLSQDKKKVQVSMYVTALLHSRASILFRLSTNRTHVVTWHPQALNYNWWR